ncbi:GntR family transcriptional regulator/MocR family aminotransferase [Lysobacter niastensis]|uniref:GntR family transcriptional regulator/MocR family aminotransferase n=1 Tax=Lysobacter niastensis TaxID=380629 RepID=A0ABU1WBX1_9GAMM|nr:PLP-dependent aminotransferase family protein [Lysobacter niastensis]MDR7134880.1 GntR family transcriptional regulator/MocR family aminotransferase [Lysobacter niastensis]
MHLQLDGRGPLHAQLTRALKTAVFAGRVHQGSRLPATRQLARELGVSRNTVLAAYEQLRAEGFVDGRVGSGSYVTPPLQALRTMHAVNATLAPQSEFARRGRLYHDHLRIPGRRIEGVRYSFQYGVPLTNPALTSSWARELAHAAAYTAPNYPMTQGLPALREAVCDYLARRRGVQAQPEDVIIVDGTQQAVALAARVLLDIDDTAVIEEPHYSSIREALLIHGAKLHTVGVDEEGLQCEALPEQGAKLVCVTPSHQFPTGVVMSLARRLELLDYAHRHGSWILEDDYDGEFRYDAQPLAALRSLDEYGRVIYVGTFSKVMFPSLRLGYMVVPAGLRGDFVNAKWQDDFGSPGIEQAALARFMADGGFERHLRRTWKTLKERRSALLDGLRRCSAGRLQINDSHAGMHLVVWLKDRTRAEGEAFIARARSLGLGLYPITPYYLDPPDRAGLLLGYCGLSVAEIDEAVERFATCLDES